MAKLKKIPFKGTYTFSKGGELEYYQAEYYDKQGGHGSLEGSGKDFRKEYNKAMALYRREKKSGELGKSTGYIGVNGSGDKFAILFVDKEYLDAINDNSFHTEEAAKAWKKAAEKFLATGKPQKGTFAGTRGYIVMNREDGITASPEVFKTEKAAKDFCTAFRKRYEAQGYYRNNRWEQVKPENIRLDIIREGDPMFAAGGAVGSAEHEIAKLKHSLVEKARKKGVYENFGQKEVRALEDKFGLTPEVAQFDEWVMNFDGSQFKGGGAIAVKQFSLAPFKPIEGVANMIEAVFTDMKRIEGSKEDALKKAEELLNSNSKFEYVVVTQLHKNVLKSKKVAKVTKEGVEPYGKGGAIAHPLHHADKTVYRKYHGTPEKGTVIQVIDIDVVGGGKRIDYMVKFENPRIGLQREREEWLFDTAEAALAGEQPKSLWGNEGSSDAPRHEHGGEVEGCGCAGDYFLLFS